MFFPFNFRDAVFEVREKLWGKKPEENKDEQRMREDEEREERRRRAKERQKKLMEEFASQQKQFMEMAMETGLFFTMIYV